LFVIPAREFTVSCARYIAGDLPVPRVVEWALLYFIQRKGGSK